MLGLTFRHNVVQVHSCTCSIRKYERPWRFKSSAVFAHLDAFRDVLHALQDIFQTASAFARMERIEVGGVQVDCPSLCQYMFCAWWVPHFLQLHERHELAFM